MFPRLHPDYGMERPRTIAPLSSHRTPRASAPIYGPDDDRPVLVYEHITGADGIRVTIRWRGTEHSARQYIGRIRLSAITWRQRTADLIAATPRDPPEVEAGALDHDRLSEQREMKLAAWRRRYICDVRAPRKGRSA